MALMIFMDNLIYFLDKDEYVIDQFLDFSKAFEADHHGVLLQSHIVMVLVVMICPGFNVILITDISS